MQGKEIQFSEISQQENKKKVFHIQISMSALCFEKQFEYRKQGQSQILRILEIAVKQMQVEAVEWEMSLWKVLFWKQKTLNARKYDGKN